MPSTTPPDDSPTGVDQPHAQSADEVAGALGVDPDVGLSADEVERRRDRVGRNVLEEASGEPWWQLLWQQLANPVVVLLVVAGVAGLLLGETIEAIAIGVVVVANTVVGFLTELKAARSMQALRGLVSTVAEVEREDRRDEVDAAELVPGDVVGVEAGERVPADLRLVECDDLRVDEAGLTGESEPVAKGPAPVDADVTIGDRTSMLFTGTTVVQGRGRGIVVATGQRTEMGRIAELAAGAEQGRAPLQEGLDQLSGRLAMVVVVGAAVLLGIGLLRGRDVAEVVEVAVALAIAVVPEGLPAVATLTLAVGMRRMADADALVRRMPAVETLGSTTVVCSDKTGTLTRNQMDVVDVVLADGADEDALWRGAALCNDADVDPDGDPVGDPTEVALLHAASEHGLDWRTLREEQGRDRAVPFDSESMRMAVVVDGTVHVKGAPEALLDRDAHAELIEAAERMAGRALRTLAIARRPAPDGEVADDDLFDDLELLGVVGMQDPPRESAEEAVATLHTAGIRTVMITGDRPDTASAIADEMQLDQQGADGRVVTGRELRAMSDEELADAVADVEVFARVEPAHKLRIIEALQAAGEVVAVTGDGVNDAPALQQADVGVAMGGGTDVAREASDVVLLDDRFGTIEVAVEEGRRIFENIRRFAQFLFSWHVAEVVVVAASVVVGFPAPLAGLMILWNNLVIDVLPSFALALEPSAGDSMRKPPRDPAEPLLDRATVRRLLSYASLVAAVGLAAFWIGRVPLGLDVDQSRTLTFLAMSAGQVLTVFNVRTDHGSGFAGATRNRWLWLALATTAVLEGLALLLPPLRDVLGLASIPATAWLAGAGLALAPLACVQLTRLVRDRGR